MDLYLNPSIVFTPAAQKNRVVPAFFFRAVRSPKTFLHYWWIEQGTGNRSFEVHRCRIEEGRPDSALGNAKRFNELFPDIAKAQRVPILPEGAELDTFLSSFTKDAIEKKNIEDKKFGPMRQAFCQIVMDRFAAAQEAIAVNDTARLNEFFKGLTIGSSKNIYGFHMQAVKDCFTAFHFYSKTYSGLRFSSFGLDDLVRYVEEHRKGYPKKLTEHEITGFTRKPAAAFHAAPAAPPYTIPNVGKDFKGIHKEYLDIVKASLKHWKARNVQMPMVGKPKQAPDAVLTPGKEDDPVIVHEYGFRGDGRPPVVIMASGGFHPNTIRYFADPAKEADFEKKRQDLYARAEKDYQFDKVDPNAPMQPHFDPWLHQDTYDAISVFLSISRAPTVAEHFIHMFGKGNGHIYLIRGVGGIDQEATFQKVQYPGEKELSVPGGVDWEDIVAFRPVVNGKPADFCYVRENNKWRMKERDVQDKAINAMMHI